MIRRANLKAGKKKRVYSSKYALSSLVFCPKCGDIYRRICWNNRGKHSVVWRCCSRVQGGPDACDAETILEEELQMATVKAFNLLYSSKDGMIEVLKRNIEEVISDKADDVLEQVETRMEELQKEILKRANSKQNYEELAQEIFELRDRKQEILAENAQKNGAVKRIAELEEYLNGFDHVLKEYDEQLVRSYIEKITVYEDKFEIEFKAGFELNIER